MLFSFGTHTAANCTDLTPQCEKCGEANHYVECCPEEENYKCCINCEGDHEARDHTCPLFLELKTMKMNKLYSDITGEFGNRSVPKPGQKMDFREMLTKHNEAQNISKNWSTFEKKSRKRVDDIENELKTIANRKKKKVKMTSALTLN